MNVINEIKRINEREQELGIEVGKGSWHDEYSDSAYVFVGGLPTDLTEGDVLTIMSQYGTVVDLNMIRDRETGKPKGFAFVAYENQLSTVLAVDNFTGTEVLGRMLRCDHVPKYRIPKKHKDRKQKSAVDSSSDESSSDSERELYTGGTAGLNPLQKRIIRAKVKRDLARQAGGDVSASNSDDDTNAPTYAHSFYAVEESARDRKKRERAERKAERKEAKRRKRAAREEQRKTSTTATTTSASKGGMSNPFLARKLREMASSEPSDGGGGGKDNKCFKCGQTGHFKDNCPN